MTFYSWSILSEAARLGTCHKQMLSLNTQWLYLVVANPRLELISLKISLTVIRFFAAIFGPTGSSVVALRTFTNPHTCRPACRGNAEESTLNAITLMQVSFINKL